VPGLNFADGPRGCVIAPATAFPVSMARGASFDPELEERIGDAIGAELRARGATYTGAVCLNLLRHPGWGRAQETYGEDPHHVGEMAAAFTTGLQRHVMACMKHFALNSMENARFKVDVEIDDRGLHEVYLPHFRRVAEAGVASVMSAYNSVRGHWCGENQELLRDILREEWNWDGFVTSDFTFGLRDPVASVKAGLNIEMPFRQQRAQVLAGAVATGELEEEIVDERVEETVATFLRFADRIATQPDASVVECDAHRALAREAAVASMVLVRNEGLLPLDAGSLRRVAVLGRLAAVVNLGDGGSSNAIPSTAVPPFEGIRAALPDAEVVHSENDASAAAGADATIVVVGLTKHDEGEFLDQEALGSLTHLFPPIDDPVLGFASEEERNAAFAQMAERRAAASKGLASEEFEFVSGGDRRSLGLRDDDVALIEAACAQSDRVVVCVIAGSAVTMPWLDRTAATLITWYPGMEGGHALADVLVGREEPGGRLPFAVPSDESRLVHFDPDATRETYGLLHGQWKLDAEGHPAHLPFGFGLGYTRFELGSASVEAGAPPVVRVRASNTGEREGETVVQVYASVPASAHQRPHRRLVGFRRIRAQAGGDATVSVPLDLRQLAVRTPDGWLTEDVPVTLHIGQSAADLPIELATDLRPGLGASDPA
jgi:beta-glucosidase